MCVRMQAQRRGRASSLDLSFQHASNSLPFCSSRRNRKKSRTRHDRRNRERKGATWDFFKRAEGSVMHLLSAADFIQFNNLDGGRIVEITKGRINEGQVPILPDSQHGKI